MAKWFSRKKAIVTQELPKHYVYVVKVSGLDSEGRDSIWLTQTGSFASPLEAVTEAIRATKIGVDEDFNVKVTSRL